MLANKRTNLELTTQFDCLPNGAPLPGFPHGDPSSSATEEQHSLARTHSSTISPSPVGAPLRARSRSPPAVYRTPTARLPFSNVLGYEFDQLEFIRLIPFKNPGRQFSLQRYTFPANKPIELLKKLNKYGPVPTQQQIVLSTFDGDVCAILVGSDTLAGIYTYDSRIHSKGRAKINIESSEVTPLTTDEIQETPVGRHRQLSRGYRVEYLNHNQSYLAPAKPPVRSMSHSPSRNISLPTRIPCSDGSTYGIEHLQLIRLSPMKNLNRLFKLQKYTFPADKLILFRRRSNCFEPIPIQELIVLTADSGDVFAILECNNDLAGIYTYNTHIRANVRAKINMQIGIVTQLTKREISEVPVGTLRPILNHFKIEHVSHNPSSFVIN